MARLPFLKVLTASEAYTVPTGKHFIGSLWNIGNSGVQLRLNTTALGIGNSGVPGGPLVDGFVLPTGTVVQGAEPSGFSGITGFLYDNTALYLPFLKIFTASESYTVPAGKHFVGSVWNIGNAGVQLRVNTTVLGIGNTATPGGPLTDGLVFPTGTVIQGAEPGGFSGMTGILFDN